MSRPGSTSPLSLAGLVVVVATVVVSTVAVAALGIGALPATLSRAAPPVRVDVGTALVEARTSPAVPGRGVDVPTVRIVARACDHVTYGTGVVLTGERVLTANHVVEGATAVEIETADGRRLAVTATARDATGRDAAVVTVPGVGSPARLGDLAASERGATVAVVGHPHGGARQVTFATVLRLVTRGPLALDGHPVLQIDMPFVSGMSGGPVLDGDQTVVALAIAVDHVSGTGLAVPVRDLSRLLDGEGTAVAPARCAA